MGKGGSHQELLPTIRVKSGYDLAKAFGLLKHRSMLILVLASLPISIIHQIYFMQTSPRGDEKNAMLTRIYGLAFESKPDLKDFIERLAEEALKMGVDQFVAQTVTLRSTFSPIHSENSCQFILERICH